MLPVHLSASARNVKGSSFQKRKIISVRNSNLYKERKSIKELDDTFLKSSQMGSILEVRRSQDHSFGSGINKPSLLPSLCQGHDQLYSDSVDVGKYGPTAKYASMKVLVNTEINLRVHKDQFSFSWVGGFTNTYGNSQNKMTLFSRPSFVHFCLSQLSFF